MNRRIILVGKTCSGKNYLRNKLEQRGFVFDISYTTREPRNEEKDGIDYHFITKDKFKQCINDNAFYEFVEYNNNYYGTGNYEWNNCNCFIMETDGIKHIKQEDRKNCFIIFLNPDDCTRLIRMKERKWSDEEIYKRIKTDNEKFKDFSDYDLIITDPNF